MNIEKDKIEKLNEYFKTKPVLKAWVFGSFVRGEERDGSDIDILVDLDYSKKIGLQFVQMQLDIEKMMGRKVDLVSSKGLSPHIKPYIEKEKQLIYAR